MNINVLGSFTSGSVVFIGSTGVLQQDNANLFWDDTNNRLGIGTTTPAQALEVWGNRIQQIRFSASATGPGFNTYKAWGSSAAPRRTKLDDAIGVFNCFGYTAVDDATLAVQSTGLAKAIFSFFAAEAFTTTNQGTYFALSTTPIGSVTAAERLRVSDVGNVKIAGTAVRGTTEGTNHLDIFDGTAPVGTLANGVSLYSTAGELRVMDAAGNATLLSPHDHETNEWIYFSKNTVTGQVLRIDMERLMKALDRAFGGGFVHEYHEAA